MKDYKRKFIKFLIDNDSLKFGEFKLKSGRISPYFLNTGMLHSGEAVYSLGRFYAETIMDRVKGEYNVVFGPAYKGIPLAVSCASSLYSVFSVNKFYSFNRKEAKTHGDTGGMIVGKPVEPDDRIILIDDVVTAGTAIRETIELLKSSGAPTIIAVVISVDRMEKGTGEISAVQELKESEGIEFYPIVNVLEIIEYLESSNHPNLKHIEAMLEYRKKYGTN